MPGMAGFVPVIVNHTVIVQFQVDVFRIATDH